MKFQDSQQPCQFAGSSQQRPPDAGCGEARPTCGVPELSHCYGPQRPLSNSAETVVLISSASLQGAGCPRCQRSWNVLWKKRVSLSHQVGVGDRDAPDPFMVDHRQQQDAPPWVWRMDASSSPKLTSLMPSPKLGERLAGGEETQVPLTVVCWKGEATFVKGFKTHGWQGYRGGPLWCSTSRP